MSSSMIVRGSSTVFHQQLQQLSSRPAPAQHCCSRAQVGGPFWWPRFRSAVAAAAKEVPAQELPITPWAFGFQCNERHLNWDQSAQVALIKIWLAEKMEMTVPEVEEQLAQLGNLLPDLVGKMERARADVLYQLLRDPAATADRLLGLRQALPGCNISALVAAHPLLMLSMTVAEVRDKADELRRRLPGVDVDALVQEEPMLLRADLPRLMSDLARLMPQADPVLLISRDPRMVLDMDTNGMPSTLEMDGVGLD